MISIPMLAGRAAVVTGGGGDLDPTIPPNVVSAGAVCWDGTQFVAIGYRIQHDNKGGVLTSPDGASWTKVGEINFGGTNDGFTDIEYVNGYYVVTGYKQTTGPTVGEARFAVSTDLVNWDITLDLPGNRFRYFLTRGPSTLYSGGGNSGVVGDGPFLDAIATSDIGDSEASWSRLVLNGIPSGATLRDMVYGNGVYVASTASSIWSSTGVNEELGILFTEEEELSFGVGSMAFGDGKFVVMDLYGLEVYTSTDGTSWTMNEPVGLSTSIVSSTPTVMRWVPQLNKFFMAYLSGNLHTATSADGITWDVTSHEEVTLSDNVASVAFSDDDFVIAGFISE